jgi:hypothetical protein
MSVSFYAADDRRLVRYLLGLLPEDEMERLDEASVVDGDTAARLRIAEDDLVDAYVGGTLDPDLRRRFESAYLATPRRRERVAFAGRFLAAIDRVAGGDASSRSRDARVVEIETRRSATAVPVPSIELWRSLVRKLPMAAAAVVVVCGALIFQTVRMRSPEREGPPDASVESSARSQETAPRPADTLRDERSALRLLPQTRAAATAIPVVALTSADAAFDLQLEPNEFTRFQAALKDPATNAVVWHSDWLAPSATDSRSVRVVVPANRFKPQHYVFELLGSGAGSRGTAGSYTFEVIRP